MLKKILSSTVVKLLLTTLLGFIFLNLLFPLDTKLYNFTYSKIYYSDDMTPMRMKLSEDDFWRFYSSNEEIPKLLKNSILTFEDKYFYKHFGINVFSIGRALVNNLMNESRIGASTITMQVVKIVEPKKRNYLNKVIELFRAVQLEINYNKEEILSMYFNKAPYGGNIEGLRAAAYFYFGKELNNLSISEMAILATIPKNPNANRPDRQENLSQKRDTILEKILNNNLINKSEYTRAIKEDIESNKRDFLFDVIQYTNSLEIDNKTDIKTTIDYDKQKFLQKFLRSETKKYHNNNLYNSAAIIIDNKTLEIKAYVGSNDFNDKQNGGENDGVRMKKSPGSTLKPFVYALALDQGLVSPQRSLLDIPLDFNGYIPKNYNDKFIGEISMEEALKLSLNIPVLDLQNQLGSNSIYELLEKTGIGIKGLKKEYGLTIAVGGIDLSLLELTKLYTILANKGNYKYDDQQLLSEESTYLISEILSDGYRNKFNSYWESSINSKKVAFKTGTSSDAKHLYTVGYTPDYTIGLWFGNFDGKKTKGDLTGSNTVLDSLIEVFEEIDNKNSWFSKPKKIKEKSICKDYYNNVNCKNLVKDFVFLDKTKCMSMNSQKIMYFNKYKNINTEEIAKDNCYKELQESNPIILSPINKKEYIFSSLIPEELRVLKIDCQPYSQKDSLILYLNGKLIKNKTFMQLSEGNYKLLCMKDTKKFNEINFTVKSSL